MKTLFVNTCLRRGSELKILPMGLAMVMTYVDKVGGIPFDLLDLDLNDFDDEYTENYIKNNKYDVILFGSIVTHYKWVKWFTRMVKQHQPDCMIIVGNSVAGSCPEVFLKNAPADAVVIGEGEVTALALLEAIRDGKPIHEIQGIACKDGHGEYIQTEKRKAGKLSDFPMVKWDYFDVGSYLNKSSSNMSWGKDDANSVITMPVTTARGCAFRCTFCHFVFWDDPYRYRTPESVIEEIQRDVNEYGATYINFWDDLSFGSIPQAERMVAALLESDVNVDWMAAIRTDLLGNTKFPYERRLKLAQDMKDSGCKAVGFSLESGSQEILEAMNKKVKKEYFSEQIKILREVGITSNTSCVFGYPQETPETIKETFDMCYENRLYPSIGFLLPLPYTKMYEYAKVHGYITDEDAYLDSITERQDININLTSMSDDEVMDHIKLGAEKLNKLLKLGLDESTYVKTGGYKKHTKIEKEDKRGMDTENPERIENDFSFNYSEEVFDVDLGVDS